MNNPADLQPPPSLLQITGGSTTNQCQLASSSDYVQSERACPPPSLSPPTTPPPPPSPIIPTSRQKSTAPQHPAVYPQSAIMRHAPSSIYAQSITSSELINKRQRPPPHSVPAQDEFKEQYYKQPPATIREPEGIHYRQCGGDYKSVAAISRSDAILFNQLLDSPQMLMLKIIATHYHYRMNTIAGINQASTEAVYACDITDYQFNLHDLYKLLAIRRGVLGRYRVASDFDFNQLTAHELRNFKIWLESIGSWTPLDGERKYILWKCSVDTHGNDILQLEENELTVNYIQLLNVIHDSLKAWKRLCHGKAFIEYTSDSAAFHFC